MSSYVHLHVHSEYSLLDGLGRMDRLVAAAADDGQPALALTDHGTLSGAFKFRNACLAAGIKPILGMEAYLAIGDDRFNPHRVQVADGDVSAVDDDAGGAATKTKANEHLTLLSTSSRGWRNLVSIHNKAQHSFHGKPLADTALLAEHAEDLICLTGCLGGPVAGPASRGDLDEARTNLNRLVEVFGVDNVYVELMEHGIEVEQVNLRRLRDLALEAGLKLVVTNDCHYPDEAMATAHEAWLAVQSGKRLDDPKRFKFNGEGFWVKTADQMRAMFTGQAWQRGCDVTVEIADRCCDDPFADLTGRKLPQYGRLPDGVSAREHLYDKVKAGAVERWGAPLPVPVKERLRDELDTVAEAGVEDYFLIGEEMMTWARSQGIATGRGRGSAGGFATSYALGLTGVDPLRYGLLSERFLERGRTDLPDIDYDFEARRRDEVIAHLVAEYGSDRVARIGTLGLSRTRASIKDAARALGSKLGEPLSKKVPVEGGKPLPFSTLLDESVDKTQDFRDEVAKHGDEADEVVELARSFEDVVKGESIHACGVVVSAVDLDDLIPLRLERKHGKIVGSPIACFDGDDIEQFGLLKLDVLGVNNLDRVAEALSMIAESTGEQLSIDTLPDPDGEQTARVRAAWDMLAEGRSSGVFQLDSSGMRDLLIASAPQSLEELSDVIALYRPGPMSSGAHDEYASRKSGAAEVAYDRYTDDPDEAAALGAVLDPTHGLMIYQELLMRLGTVVAGFDAAGRSKLRKAVGKKKKDLMDQVGRDLIDGAEAEVVDEDGEVVSPVFFRRTAERLWEDIKGAGEYAFNKSHSVTYGALSFINAYLKANWPVEFGAAVLAMTPKDAEKRKLVLDSLAEEGIAVEAPDINTAQATTTAVGGRVVIGLAEIRDVGQVAEQIVAERESDGPFTSVRNLFVRVRVPNGEDGGTRALSAKTIEALIEAGALDQFGPRRGLLTVALAAKAVETDVPDLEWGTLERSARQRHRLGFTVGQSPLVELKPLLKQWRPADVNADGVRFAAAPVPLPKAAKSDGTLLTLGILTSWKVFPGSRASFTIEGTTQAMPVTMWNRSLAPALKRSGEPTIGDVVAVLGRSQRRVFTREVTDDDGVVSDVVVERTEFAANDMWVVDGLAADDASLVDPDAQVIDFMSVQRDRAQDRAVCDPQEPSPSIPTPVEAARLSATDAEGTRIVVSVPSRVAWHQGAVLTGDVDITTALALAPDLWSRDAVTTPDGTYRVPLTGGAGYLVLLVGESAEARADTWKGDPDVRGWQVATTAAGSEKSSTGSGLVA
ncbi:DNA polymerase III subunit alpha [Aeromicrobium sp. CTD01-1L150]|uniref:DNA polymerase III subunit alpha n=1 Tax=Aeromicrobium sp. CTD01-1L150 TaxID=3341830 RepID=UPI0035C1FF36